MVQDFSLRSLQLRLLRNRGDARGVGRGLQLCPHFGRERVVDGTTDRSQNGKQSYREKHRHIAGLVATEAANFAEERVHEVMPMCD